MNSWQYSRWVYLVGRSIKNKSLQISEKQAIIIFIKNMLQLRPMLISQVNIKKGSLSNIEKQNDYSLGKMIQVIGRNLKVLPITLEWKKICDKLFFSTDKRRYMNYNEYQALKGNDFFVSVDDDLNLLLENCNENSVFNLSAGVYNTDLNVVVNGIKIVSQNDAIIKGKMVITANNVIIQNIIIDYNTLQINSEQKIENISIKGITTNDIILDTDISNLVIQNSILNGDKSIVFNGNSENILVTNCEINGEIIFNNSLDSVQIINNNINSENGIIINSQDNGNITLDGNNFNWEK